MQARASTFEEKPRPFPESVGVSECRDEYTFGLEGNKKPKEWSIDIKQDTPAVDEWSDKGGPWKN